MRKPGLKRKNPTGSLVVYWSGKRGSKASMGTGSDQTKATISYNYRKLPKTSVCLKSVRVQNDSGNIIRYSNNSGTG